MKQAFWETPDWDGDGPFWMREPKREPRKLDVIDVRSNPANPFLNVRGGKISSDTIDDLLNAKPATPLRYGQAV